jgi:uncharacterized protein YndB with AHSA1/START domain
MAASAGVEEIVEVQVYLEHRAGAVWNALTSPEGTARWLGAGAVLGDKGQSYHCDDGSHGVVRSFHPLEQLRLTWHASGADPTTMIEVDVTPEGPGTRLRLWHEGLQVSDHGRMQAMWRRRVDDLLLP